MKNVRRTRHQAHPALDIPLSICYPFLQIKMIRIYFETQ